MSIISTTVAAEGLEMSEPLRYAFFSQISASSTSYVWDTGIGNLVTLTGSGITSNGSTPTGGTITGITMSLGGGANSGYSVSGLSASLVTLASSPTAMLNAIMGGNDTITTSSFDDTLKGAAGDDVIIAGGGDDILYGGSGNDTLNGDAGHDTLVGGLGADSIIGGAGFDYIEVSAADLDANNDTVDGGASVDELTISGSGVFDLTGWTFSNMEVINFTDVSNTTNATLIMTDAQLANAFGSYVEFEGNADAGTSEQMIINMTGSSFTAHNWTFADFNNLTGGDDQAIVVNGTSGTNYIGTSLMTDSLSGGAGNDDFDLRSSTYAFGNDTIDGGAGNDELYLLDIGFYTLNAGLVLSSIEEIQFANGAGTTTFNLVASTIDGPGELSANATITGSGATDRLVIDMASSETFDVSGWDISSLQVGIDQIYFQNGGSANSNITTTDFAEYINTGYGSATVNAGGGDDYVLGSDSGDFFSGDTGQDTLNGWFGADYLLGGDGNDFLYDFLDGGGSDTDTDTLGGGLGDDYIQSTGGSDVIDLTGGGVDTIALDGDGGTRTVMIISADTDDLVDLSLTSSNITVQSNGTVTSAGGLTTDITGIVSLVAGSGDDTVFEGNLSYLDLGAGNDRFIGGADAFVDRINGGAGIDTYQNADGSDYNINLRTGVVDGAVGVLTNFENFIGNGAGGNETVSAWAGGSNLNGAAGNDVLIGGIGNDTLTGGSGTDRLTGGDGNDSVDGSSGNDTLRGDGGNDTLSGQANADQLFGGDNNDQLFGGAGFDVLNGDDGDDLVDGGGDNDTVNGGNGHDTVLGVAGSDVIDGGAGNDSILGGNGFDTIEGGSGNDTIDSGLGNDVVSAGANNDSVLGNAGSDTIDGGSGNDTLEGQGGNDLLTGGSGNDLITGGVNSDTLIGGTGNDTLQGDTGADDFVFTDNGGADVINDFLVNVDDLDFSGLSAINNFAGFAAAASNVGADMVITFGGGHQVTLLGVQEAQFDAADFIF